MSSRITLKWQYFLITLNSHSHQMNYPWNNVEGFQWTTCGSCISSEANGRRIISVSWSIDVAFNIIGKTFSLLKSFWNSIHSMLLISSVSKSVLCNPSSIIIDNCKYFIFLLRLLSFWRLRENKAKNNSKWIKKRNKQNNYFLPAYYVIGGGVKTAIMQENVAATNGIIHYIERVLGVPYQSLWEILKNETRLQWVITRVLISHN